MENQNTRIETFFLAEKKHKMGYLLVDPKPPVPLEVLPSNFSTSSKETSSGFKKIICAILSPILMSTSEAAKLLDHT